MEQPAPGGEQPQATPPDSQNPTPTAPQAPVAAPEKKPDITEALSAVDLTKFSDAQLADLESGDAARIAQALNLPPPPEPTPAPAAAASAPVPDKKVGEDEITDGADGPTRISLKSVGDKAARTKIAQVVADLRSGKFGSIEESIGHHFGLAKPDAQAGKGNGQDSPDRAHAATPQKSERISGIEAKMADLVLKRNEARATFSYDQAEALTDELAELKIELRNAEQSEADAAKSATTWVASENASRDAALAKYSELLTDPDSEFNDLLDYEIHLAEKKDDPILKAPDWPEKIADRVFEKNRAKFEAGKTDSDKSTPQEQPIPPAPRPGVRVPGAPVGGSANTTALTASAALTEFDALSPQEQMAVLAKLDAMQKAAA